MDEKDFRISRDGWVYALNRGEDFDIDIDEIVEDILQNPPHEDYVFINDTEEELNYENPKR